VDAMNFNALMVYGVYAAVFLGPFVQEDAAVLGGATAAMTSPHPELVLGLLFLGLMVSDTWKYVAGRMAGRWRYVARLAEGPRAAKVGEVIRNRLGLALLTARFVPGTRIPLYVLAGLNKAPVAKFLIVLALSALAYISIATGLVWLIGAKAATGLTIAAVVALAIGALILRFRRPRVAQGV
jgi:membrane protein DedA with SNARE-associated domain